MQPQGARPDLKSLPQTPSDQSQHNPGQPISRPPNQYNRPMPFNPNQRPDSFNPNQRPNISTQAIRNIPNNPLNNPQFNPNPINQQMNNMSLGPNNQQRPSYSNQPPHHPQQQQQILNNYAPNQQQPQSFNNRNPTGSMMPPQSTTQRPGPNPQFMRPQGNPPNLRPANFSFQNNPAAMNNNPNLIANPANITQPMQNPNYGLSRPISGTQPLIQEANLPQSRPQSIQNADVLLQYMRPLNSSNQPNPNTDPNMPNVSNPTIQNNKPPANIPNPSFSNFSNLVPEFSAVTTPNLQNNPRPLNPPNPTFSNFSNLMPEFSTIPSPNLQNNQRPLNPPNPSFSNFSNLVPEFSGVTSPNLQNLNLPNPSFSNYNNLVPEFSGVTSPNLQNSNLPNPAFSNYTNLVPNNQPTANNNKNQPPFNQQQQMSSNNNQQPFNQQQMSSNNNQQQFNQQQMPNNNNQQQFNQQRLNNNQQQQQYNNQQQFANQQQYPNQPYSSNESTPNPRIRQPNERLPVDPASIPGPIQVLEADQLIYDNCTYGTLSKNSPPFAATFYHSTDEGCSTPRFARLTCFTLASTDEIMRSTHIPLGLVIQPLANIGHEESPVPIVQCGETGPVRCSRCKGYMNPFCRFAAGGNKFICNLCSFENDVGPDYFCNLDMNGRRLDMDMRPELRYGTIDYIASKEYCARPALPLSIVFLIDVSFPSIQSGMLERCSEGIKHLLFSSPLEKGIKIGIITFDRALHFYNLNSSLELPQLMVVSDINDVFVPLSEGFLVDPEASKNVILHLLSSLVSMHQATRSSESVLGSALLAANVAMKSTGGKVIVFQTSLPTSGPGALKNREDPRLSGSDKERLQFEPADFFWRKIATDFSNDGITVDLFLFPTPYLDIASIGNVSSTTGGSIFLFSHFNPHKDGAKFINDLVRCVSQTVAYDAMLRVRCSNGLKVTEYLGNFLVRNQTEVELAGITTQTTLAVGFKITEPLDEKVENFFQCAILYTSSSGLRLIRVINMSASTTLAIGSFYRTSDLDTVINYLAKYYAAETVKLSLKTIRDSILQRCMKLLSGYRRHCAQNTASAQLILPESYKLLPLYGLLLSRCRAFTLTPYLNSDERVTIFKMMSALPVLDSSVYLYPQAMCLDPLHENDATITSSGRFVMPKQVRLGYEFMNPESAYLIENGLKMMMWIGSSCRPEFLMSVFGVTRIDQVDVNQLKLPVLPNPISEKIRKVISHIQETRARFCQLQIVRQKLDPALESEFSMFMVEDKNMDSPGYADYLCLMHKEIQFDIANN